MIDERNIDVPTLRACCAVLCDLCAEGNRAYWAGEWLHDDGDACDAYWLRSELDPHGKLLGADYCAFECPACGIAYTTAEAAAACTHEGGL